MHALPSYELCEDKPISHHMPNKIADSLFLGNTPYSYSYG